MKHKIFLKSLMILVLMGMAMMFPGCKNQGGSEMDQALLEKPVEQLTSAEMAKMTAVIETNFGAIKFKFYPEKAPNHCRNFIKLAQKGFYNNLIFHRVIKGFMIQGGDPNGDGSGGPGYTIKAEFNDQPHLKGTVSTARRSGEPDSAGSQFFICLDRKDFLNGQYTVFGQVTQGQEVVDQIGSLPTRNERPTQDVVMKKVYIELAK